MTDTSHIDFSPMDRPEVLAGLFHPRPDYVAGNQRTLFFPVKSKIVGIVIGLALIACIAACGSDNSVPSSEDTSDYTLTKTLDSYEFDPSVPLIDRVSESPDFVLSYLEDVMDATQIYTPFASLYASQNWAEDFAEYCAWYYFTTQLGQPYVITVSRDGTTDMVYEPMESFLVRDRTGVPSL